MQNEKLLLALTAAIIVATAWLAVFVKAAHATWKPEYADASPQVQDWYRNAELTLEAQKRLHFKSCCASSDVVHTKFRVNKTDGADEWFWLVNGEYRLVPPDIIHWEESAPDGQPTLFAVGELPTCFYPGESGN